MAIDNYLSKEFEAFFIRNYPKVKAFARRLLMREQEVDDIAQDIFLKIADRPDIWQDAEAGDKYLFTMTRNHVFNIIKHRNIERKYEAEAIAENRIADELELNDKLHVKEMGLLIDHVIAQMPPHRKEIFTLSRFDGLSNACIAEQLELSIRTVERHLYLALKDLRQALHFYLSD
jgi:RNA polymerase sigma-70 factor (ECF subfamily)